MKILFYEKLNKIKGSNLGVIIAFAYVIPILGCYSAIKTILSLLTFITCAIIDGKIVGEFASWSQVSDTFDHAQGLATLFLFAIFLTVMQVIVDEYQKIK